MEETSGSEGGGGEGRGASVGARVARVAAVLLGLPFVLAAGVKILGPAEFMSSLGAYGVPELVRPALVVALPALELGLGVALIAGWRLRTAGAAAAVLLMVFMGAIGYGMSRGGLEDCGCFGPFLERSPQLAFGQNVVLLVLGLVVTTLAPATPSLSPGRRRVLAAVVALAMIGTGLSWTLSPPLSGVVPGGATIDGRELDLRSGEQLLYLFHPECPYCAEVAPRVAAYAADPSLPPVTGVTADISDAEAAAYLAEHGLALPVLNVAVEDLVRITGEGSVPQLAYVRDGEVVRHWAGGLPLPAALRSQLERTR